MDHKHAWRTIAARATEAIPEARDREEFDNLVLRDAESIELDGQTLQVQLTSHHVRQFVEEHFGRILDRVVQEVLGPGAALSFCLPARSTATPNPRATPTTEHREAPGRMRLDAQLTFDNFVVGGCNRIAHAAAKAAVDAPGRKWNPLYIYGASGLGKTHLLNAIGHAIHEQDSRARVMYVTADDFTHEFVQAIRGDRTRGFRMAYREEATVLLMDDIQFLSGNDATQEELFYIFNVMQQQCRQMVFTSDVEPSEIQKLEARLRTRFQGGQIVDMQPPDPETATAIVLERAQSDGLDLPEELAKKIAQAASGNMREMLGVLNKLILQCETDNVPPTVEYARQSMPHIFSPVPQEVTVEDILVAIADNYNMRKKDLLGKNRTKRLTRPRHIAMYLARKHTSLSFPDLGEAFGRDHSTIQHGVKKIQKDLDDGTDTELLFEVKHLEKRLRSI